MRVNKPKAAVQSSALLFHLAPHSLLHHGNKGHVPPNTFNFDNVNRLTTFMVNYDGMPHPGRVPGHRDKVMVLPSDITKLLVLTKYRDACLHNGWTAAGRSKFYGVWQSVLPHISITKPASDHCFTCQQNSLALQSPPAFQRKRR